MKQILFRFISPLVILVLSLSCLIFTSCKDCDGQGTLQVTIVDRGIPIPGIEVDLWTSAAPGKHPAPDAGIALTDRYGIVTFEVPAGQYDIGFNKNEFPHDKFIFPGEEDDESGDDNDDDNEEDLVPVRECETTEITIELQRR